MAKKVAAILLVLFILTGCSGGGTNEEEVVIRGIIPKTGSVAVFGNTAENGIRMAVDQINNSGGIGGVKINYSSLDDRASADKAKSSYAQFTEKEDADIIVGPITIDSAEAVAKHAAKNGVVMISPSATGLELNSSKNYIPEEDRSTIFRACLNYMDQGIMLAQFAKNEFKTKTATVLLNETGTYSKVIGKSFMESAKSKGIEIVAEEYYSENDILFKEQLLRIS